MLKLESNRSRSTDQFASYVFDNRNVIRTEFFAAQIWRLIEWINTFDLHIEHNLLHFRCKLTNDVLFLQSLFHAFMKYIFFYLVT